MIRPPPRSTLFPYPPLSRSEAFAPPRRNHDPVGRSDRRTVGQWNQVGFRVHGHDRRPWWPVRSEEHTSELQSRLHLVCRLLLEKKKKKNTTQQSDRS